MSANPGFSTSPFTQFTVFEHADGVEAKTVAANEAYWMAIRQVLVTNSDEVDHDVYLKVVRGTTVCTLLRTTIPAGSGWVLDTPPVNLITPTLLPGLYEDPNTFLPLQAGDELQIAMQDELPDTLGVLVNVVVFGGQG